MNMKTDRENYFEKLNSNSAEFPTTEQEIIWFDEWCKTTDEGKRVTEESEKGFNEMVQKHSVELMMFVFWLREIKRQTTDEFNLSVKVVNKKNFIFTSDNEKMNDTFYGKEHRITF